MMSLLSDFIPDIKCNLKVTMTTFTCAPIMWLFPVIRQSKGLFKWHEQTSLLLFTCNFYCSDYFLRFVVIYTAIIRIPQCTAQMMNSHRVCVAGQAPSGKDLFGDSLILGLSQFSCDVFIMFHPSVYCIIFMLCSVVNTAQFLQHAKNAHAHFGQSRIDVIKMFTCLFIAIKISIRHVLLRLSLLGLRVSWKWKWREGQVW